MRRKETDSGTFDGVLRYVFNDGGLEGFGAKSTSTIIRDASIRVSGTQWNSVDGKFTYQRSQNDLIVTIKDMNKKEWRMAA